jgi:hypothetical protein
MGKVQSLSVVVPTRKCINQCKFCVSRLVDDNDKYEDMLNNNNIYYNLYERDYKQRLQFAQDRGCDTIILTGNGEPQQNKSFLMNFGSINKSLSKPFSKIELQTTGVMLDGDYLYFLRNHVGIKTISLSISSFDEHRNKLNMQYNDSMKFLSFEKLVEEIKVRRFNLRISINLTSDFDDISVEKIFRIVKEKFRADQVTFRVLYNDDNYMEKEDGAKIHNWIEKNKAKDETVERINDYIKENGRALEKLDFGLVKYSVNGIGTVVDDDCMNEEVKNDIKYFILRPNCKLYTKWDDEGSLIY